MNKIMKFKYGHFSVTGLHIGTHSETLYLCQGAENEIWSIEINKISLKTFKTIYGHSNLRSLQLFTEIHEQVMEK